MSRDLGSRIDFYMDWDLIFHNELFIRIVWEHIPYYLICII